MIGFAASVGGGKHGRADEAPIAPGPAIRATTFQSTFLSFQWENRTRRWSELGEVHRGRRRSGSQAGEDEKRARRDAVAHAEAAVDELGHEADEGQNNQFTHRGGSSDEP